MPKTIADVGSARPLLDIASYARRGPGQRGRLSPEELGLIERTVRRTPEVMVKVLSRGGQDMRSVGRHFSYLSRTGSLTIETDDGREIRSKDSEAEVLKDWDLDIQEQRPTSSLGAGLSREAPKLVHKVIFSMPPGTPPRKVLEAVRAFAREEFGLKHRYAMVLHTDEPHPHVHLVIKAVSEEGARLNIRKATLRGWRLGFARRLREQGVEANATDRAVRGNSRAAKLDGIYRAARRGESHYIHDRSAEALDQRNRTAAGEGATLRATRRNVQRGWSTLRDILAANGQMDLAERVRLFCEQMSPARTDREQLASTLRGFELPTRHASTREP
jgi:predicted transcriptional regulator